ncbi:MAG: hypothetical protein K2L75_06910 [Muribaculaceae bacterium]|nr:hypothetical protein [Muribaculaceae bacterium]
MKNRYKVLTAAAAMMIGAISAQAYTASYYTGKSVLSSGHVVKLAVDTTGIYEISHEELRALGFSNPSKVHVFGYGGIVCTEQGYTVSYPDDLPQAASMHTADGRLLFYGEGVFRATIRSKEQIVSKRNHYDTSAYYFLSDATTGTTVPTHPLNTSEAGSMSVYDWSYAIDVIENEVQNPGNGSVYFHDRKLNAGESQRFDFHIRDFKEVPGVTTNGFFQYEGALLTPASVKFPITASPNLYLSSNTPGNGSNTTKSTYIYRNISGTARFIPTEECRLDDAHVSLTVSVPETFVGTYAAMDKAFIIYPRHNTLEGRSELCINLPRSLTNQLLTIGGADAETEIWNVTDPVNVFRYETSFDDTSATVTASLSSASAIDASRIFAFRPSETHRAPRIIGAVPNQNLHGSRNPDMLIVTAASHLESARELASIHRRTQGFEVLVVTQEQAFNEFTSGSRHPNGIRRLAKMFYDRDKSKLRYLLLYGAGTYDNRGISREDKDYLVTYECESILESQESTTNYASDLYFGMLADNYSHASIYSSPTHISIGRIPANNAQEAHDANAKIKDYLANPPSVKNYLRSLMLSGAEDNYSHLAQSTEAADIIRHKSPAFTSVRGDDCLYNSNSGNIQRITEQALAGGIGYFTYSGHADLGSLDGRNYTFHHAEKYEYDTYPFAMLATCYTYPFDVLETNIAEKMFFKAGGGAIGVLASCRSVYLEHNRTLNSAVATAYANASDGTCIGDLQRIARNTMISNGMQPALGHNSMSYNLCGDPAIPINAPTHRVAIDLIDGKSPLEGTVDVNALTPVAIKGRVVDAEGNTVSGFNGTAIIEVYDTPLKYRFKINDTTYTEVTQDDTPIASVSATVTDGIIEGNILVANPQAQGDYNRLTVIANAGSGATAAGGTLDMRVVYAEHIPEGVDDSAPEIEEMYIDTPEFSNGDTVDKNFKLYITATPSATGIENRSNYIGNISTLALDGIRLSDEIKGLSFGEDGKLHLTAIFSDISEGHHTITVKLVNRLGKSSSHSIDFNVSAQPAYARLVVDEDSCPARSEATISLDTYETEIQVHRLLILDDTGRTVLSKTGVLFPFVWDLTDNNGKRVPDGLYKVSALFTTPSANGSTAATEIVVVK